MSIAAVEKVVTTSSLKLFCQSLGEDDSPPLLLLPPVTALSDKPGAARSDSPVSLSLHWPESFCQTLALSGCRVIRFEHESLGKSGSADVSEQHLNALWAVADAHDLPQFHLAGRSLSGLLAQIAVLRNPRRIRSLILIASAPLEHDLSEAHPWPADAETSPDLVEKISMPVLILHGDQDPIVSLAWGESLAKALPNARLHVLRGVGHELPEARMPEILTEILDFLAEQHR